MQSVTIKTLQPQTFKQQCMLEQLQLIQIQTNSLYQICSLVGSDPTCGAAALQVLSCSALSSPNTTNKDKASSSLVMLLPITTYALKYPVNYLCITGKIYFYS